MENSAQGLSMLEPEHKVVVTGEEHHQDALASWAPRADGRPRRVAAELGFVTGPRGRRVIEVRIDGRRVGGLTVLMSERYAPHVHEVLRRGGRPGCVATVVHGRRGLVEVQLFLPEVDRTGTAVLPPPAPRPAPAGPPPGARPEPGGSGPAPRGPDGRGPAPAGARRGRRPLWIAGGVVALLVAVGVGVGGGADEPAEVATRPAAVPVVALPPTAAAGTTAPSTSIVTSRPVADPDRDGDDDPARVAPAESRRPAPTAEPARTTERAPEPEPAAVYYANCAAVRAAGAAPIRVGQPGYRSALDRDGDGQGCGAD